MFQGNLLFQSRNLIGIAEQYIATAATDGLHYTLYVQVYKHSSKVGHELRSNDLKIFGTQHSRSPLSFFSPRSRDTDE